MPMITGIQAMTTALGVAGALGAPPFPRAADRVGALPGARVLAAGPFLFYAALYADPRLRPPATAIAAWLASDVPGVGARLLWFYRGRGTLGPVVERYASLGTTGCVGATYPVVRLGDRGGRPSGGLIVPVGARPGRRVGFALDLATPRGNWGVVIRYTLRAGAGASTPTVGAISVAASGGHTLPVRCNL